MLVVNDATVKGGTYYPLTVKSTCAPRPSPSGCAFPASIWWIPAVPSCRCRTRCSPTGIILAASSTTRPACRPRTSPAGGGDGALHCRRRLRARHGGRVDHGQRAGHHLSGGPAAGQGRHRREISAEALGGAEVHCTHSGVADHMARDDGHALAIARTLVTHLGNEPVETNPGYEPPATPSRISTVWWAPASSAPMTPGS